MHPKEESDLDLPSLRHAGCPGCGAVGTLRHKTEVFAGEFRGMPFSVDRVQRECGLCGAVFCNTKDPDAMVEIKRLYAEHVAA